MLRTNYARVIPGPLAEFIIGPRLARTRWLASRNDRLM